MKFYLIPNYLYMRWRGWKHIFTTNGGTCSIYERKDVRITVFNPLHLIHSVWQKNKRLGISF